jgi:hypothetical protein
MGINIMIGGLSFQVFSLVLFAVLCGEFAFRLWRNPQSWNMTHERLFRSMVFKCFLWGLTTATFTILIRSCFRVAELSGGFHGPLANNQPTFMVLEGGMVAIASICLTILHPGIGFRGTWSDVNFNLFRAKKTARDTDTEMEPKTTSSSPHTSIQGPDAI